MGAWVGPGAWQVEPASSARPVACARHDGGSWGLPTESASMVENWPGRLGLVHTIAVACMGSFVSRSKSRQPPARRKRSSSWTIIHFGPTATFCTFHFFRKEGRSADSCRPEQPNLLARCRRWRVTAEKTMHVTAMSPRQRQRTERHAHAMRPWAMAHGSRAEHMPHKTSQWAHALHPNVISIPAN